MKVLIADDDPDVRGMLHDFLALQQFEVLDAGNGLEALWTLKHERPHAIVLDVDMPRLGGIDALKHIHRFDPSVVVVVITGRDDAEVRREALARGARAVLGKPVPLSELLAALQAPRTAPPQSAGHAAATPAAGVGDAAASVLIVDDELDVRAMLTDFVEGRGYRVHAVADAAEAMRAVAATPPAVVLLNIDLPGLKGVEALPAIRALAPSAHVIMVSGTADASLAQRALALGAFDYVAKPIDLTHLAQCIETAMAMRTLEL